MEEPATLEEPPKPSTESVNADPQVSPESSTTDAANESSVIEDASQNVSQLPSESDTICVDTPKQGESDSDSQDSKVDESLHHPGGHSIDPTIPSQSGAESGVVQVSSMEPHSSTQQLEAATESVESIKSGPNAESLSSLKPLEIQVESPVSPPSPSELSSPESPNASTLTSESGAESPKSPNPLESSPESPTSIASNESGESALSESDQSQKSGSSSTTVRRKSKLMDSYSKIPSKLNHLESQLEVVASLREKDVLVKQEYKVQEESLREKRESIIKEMHREEKKAKMERKATFRAGTGSRLDLNASRRDSRKDDLNGKKEEDERNKQLLLQRARDEKNLRKSIYQSNNKSPSGTQSPSSSPSQNSSSPAQEND